jgi:uncharacterized protein
MPVDIFQAVRLDDRESFRSGIDGTSINVTNEFGQNLLHEAAGWGNVVLGEELIARGVNVNHQDSIGQTPLHYAAEHKYLRIAEGILRAGGKLNISDRYGNQPLWTAVFNARGDYRLVMLVCKSGANPVHQNKAGKSPLDFARQIKDAALIAILEGKTGE